ncbi:MAG: zf-HC2 domain-containing protein [Candidatus Eisenbacteria bacterium]
MSTLDCKETRRLIVLDLDRELADNDAPAIATHLAACSSCREWRRGHQDFKRLWAAAPRILYRAEDRFAIRSYPLRVRWPAFYPPTNSVWSKLLFRGRSGGLLDQLTALAAIGSVVLGVQLLKERLLPRTPASRAVATLSERDARRGGAQANLESSLEIERPF